jgi:hypothetical protein
LSPLSVFVGSWMVEVSLPGAAPARSVFEWILGGAYLLQRTSVPMPEAPDSFSVVAAEPADGRYVQHYFDSRGVSRVYEMTLVDNVWTLTRSSADFSPLDFAQRYVGVISADGGRISGRWETAPPGGSEWELDFALNYTRER